MSKWRLWFTAFQTRNHQSSITTNSVTWWLIINHKNDYNIVKWFICFVLVIKYKFNLDTQIYISHGYQCLMEAPKWQDPYVHDMKSCLKVTRFSRFCGLPFCRCLVMLSHFYVMLLTLQLSRILPKVQI